MRQLPLFVASALALTASAGLAHAVPLASGELWEVSQASAMNATVANALAQVGTLNVTFTAPSNPLSFDSRTAGNGYTIGGFLATGGASGITYHGGTASGNTMDGTLFYFTGSVSVTNGEIFNISHDDGFELIIGGASNFDFSDPGPSSPALTPVTYTGVTGTESFQLAYGECCGAPAVLYVDLPLQATPLPAALPLFASGLGVVGFLGLRRKRKAAAIAV